MNRRIRKKRIDEVDRLLADGLRLYTTRPLRRTNQEEWDRIAVKLLNLTIGLALRDRIRRLPGPYFGAEVDPPRGLTVEVPSAGTINAAGLLLIRDRQGEEERAVLRFRLSASRVRERWTMTRVFMTAADRETWEQAV